MTRWLFLASAAAVLVLSQQNRCHTKRTCSDCIISKGCIFCSDKTLNESLFRCELQRSLTEEWKEQCPEKDRHMAEAMLYTTNNNTTDGKKIVLSPREMELQIGQDQPYNITIKATVRDKPTLEMYLLMDLSRTMLDDKENLYKLTEDLVKELHNLTSDLPKIGFGAFIDKPIRPYMTIYHEEGKEDDSCKNIKCDDVWGYRHYVKLTNNSEKVMEAVSHAPVAVNVDPLEGGFDGIMQAMVCEDVIGWTAATEKVLVYLSDAEPHMAGDGRLAGINIQNDMKCHMEEVQDKNYTHDYSYSKIMDYPSVGQLNQMAEEYDVSLIFAVAKKKTPLYRRISSRISKSSYAALEGDSSNIVELIKDEYEKIQQSLTLGNDVNNDYVSLRHFSKCKGDVMHETTQCSNLTKDDQVEFIVEVNIKSCKEIGGENVRSIKIWPSGDKNNALELKLKPFCKCACEEDSEPNSSECSNHGTLMCGICQCNPRYAGKNCQCRDDDDDEGGSCRKGNSTKICSGSDRGSCKCDECRCEEGYSGRYCECADMNCPRGTEGKLCSGHGECKCGNCICEENGWTGEACDCSTQQDACLEPGQGKICSSHGICKCNRCICKETNGHNYTGARCETCKDCPKRCQELNPCVLCQYRGDRGGDNTQCDQKCTMQKLNITFADNFDEPDDSEELCSVKDGNECRVSYKYAEGTDASLHVQIRNKRECPKPTNNVLAVVLSVIGTILAIGVLALLAWKKWTNYQDGLEFRKFKDEQANAKWGENINMMYKPATTITDNPAYGKQD